MHPALAIQKEERRKGALKVFGPTAWGMRKAGRYGSLTRSRVFGSNRSYIEQRLD